LWPFAGRTLRTREHRCRGPFIASASKSDKRAVNGTAAVQEAIRQWIDVLTCSQETVMLGARLMQLIETHAAALTKDVVQDLTTNENTPSFATLEPPELEKRVSELCWNLGKWIGNPDDNVVRDEYEHMGRERFREGAPVSEVIYALLVTKKHLRSYIRQYGLVDFAGDRVVPDELLPIELHSIQELNYQVGEFFDRALYHLARGYELEAAVAVA
jgi:hypothetical protein